MPDLDTELRRLAGAIADEAPAAPRYEDLDVAVLAPVGHGARWLTRVLVAAAAAVVVAVVVVAALVIGRDTSTKQVPLGPATFVPCRDEKPGPFAGPNGKTFGPVANPNPEAGGTMTPEQFAAIPDYIPVSCRSGVGTAGYVKKTDLFGADQRAIGGIMTVYADDGSTVVGQFGGGKGFVGLNEDPNSIPNGATSTTTPPTVPRTP